MVTHYKTVAFTVFLVCFFVFEISSHLRDRRDYHGISLWEWFSTGENSPQTVCWKKTTDIRAFLIPEQFWYQPCYVNTYIQLLKKFCSYEGPWTRSLWLKAAHPTVDTTTSNHRVLYCIFLLSQASGDARDWLIIQRQCVRRGTSSPITPPAHYRLFCQPQGTCGMCQCEGAAAFSDWWPEKVLPSPGFTVMQQLQQGGCLCALRFGLPEISIV